jgi:ABC-2 type transport system permease protein
MLPEWAQILSFFNPIYYMINGIRFSILGISDSLPIISFGMALAMALIFFSSAVALMKSGRKIKL